MDSHRQIDLTTPLLTTQVPHFMVCLVPVPALDLVCLLKCFKRKLSLSETLVLLTEKKMNSIPENKMDKKCLTIKNATCCLLRNDRIKNVETSFNF